jgi:lipid-A-disaccharide synthase-like uncharacterized protein
MNKSWLVIGIFGQLFFTCRFLLQWLASERVKKSVVPVAFWYCSIIGGGLLLGYALHQRDPVFIVGQLTGLVIYCRNIILVVRERKAQKQCLQL